MNRAVKILITSLKILAVFAGTIVLLFGSAVFFIFLFSFFLAGVSDNSDLIVDVGMVTGLIFMIVSPVILRVVLKKVWKWDKSHTITWWLGIITVLLLLFTTNLSVPRRTPEMLRVSSINQLRTAMELYFDDNKSLFPPATLSCADIGVLAPYLIPNYVSRVSSDPEISKGHPNYMVAINSQRKRFVLRALLENKESSVLKNDLDGNIMGCDCDDPNYCIGSNSI